MDPELTGMYLDVIRHEEERRRLEGFGTAKLVNITAAEGEDVSKDESQKPGIGHGYIAEAGELPQPDHRGASPFPSTPLSPAAERVKERLAIARQTRLEDGVDAALAAETRRQHTLPRDSAKRKEYPIYSGVIRYFPAALAEVARVSKIGNDKHNPGQEMHHARGKSMDHADCQVRHMIDAAEAGGRDADGVPELAYKAWRALAELQEWLEKNDGAPLAPGAKLPEEPPRPYSTLGKEILGYK